MGKAPAACAEAILGEEVVGGRLGWGLSRQSCWLATREALLVTGAGTHGSHRFGVSRMHGVCAWRFANATLCVLSRHGCKSLGPLRIDYLALGVLTSFELAF